MARGGCGGSATPERGRGDEVGGGRGGEGGRTSRCVLGRRERGASSKNNYMDSPVSGWSDVHRHADDVDPAERLRRLTVVNSVSAGGCASASRASTSLQPRLTAGAVPTLPCTYPSSASLRLPYMPFHLLPLPAFSLALVAPFSPRPHHRRCPPPPLSPSVPSWSGR